jgi:hypothetical protein
LLGDFGTFQVGLASNLEGPKTLGIVDLHSARGFTQNIQNYLGRGLDEFRELAILIDGLGVDQAVFRGITVGSKRRFFPA